MAQPRWIRNLSGTLQYLDTPILEFEIQNRRLVRSKDLSGGKLYPWELAVYGVSYGNINAFFERRTIKENCMLYRERLKALGMETMDFDEYIRLNNGSNHLDNYWVKFENAGANSFEEL